MGRDHQVGQADEEEADADGDVDLEAGDVYASEVVGSDEGVLISQEDGHGDDAEEVEPAHGVGPAEGEEGDDHGGVAGGGQPEGAPDAEPGGDAVQALAQVEGDVLAGVDDVEPGDPEQDRQAQQRRGSGEVAAEGDPGGHGGHGERGAEPDVGEAGEPLGV